MALSGSTTVGNVGACNAREADELTYHSVNSIISSLRSCGHGTYNLGERTTSPASTSRHTPPPENAPCPSSSLTPSSSSTSSPPSSFLPPLSACTGQETQTLRLLDAFATVLDTDDSKIATTSVGPCVREDGVYAVEIMACGTGPRVIHEGEYSQAVFPLHEMWDVGGDLVWSLGHEGGVRPLVLVAERGGQVPLVEHAQVVNHFVEALTSKPRSTRAFRLTFNKLVKYIAASHAVKVVERIKQNSYSQTIFQGLSSLPKPSSISASSGSPDSRASGSSASRGGDGSSGLPAPSPPFPAPHQGTPTAPPAGSSTPSFRIQRDRDRIFLERFLHPHCIAHLRDKVPIKALQRVASDLSRSSAHHLAPPPTSGGLPPPLPGPTSTSDLKASSGSPPSSRSSTLGVPATSDLKATTGSPPSHSAFMPGVDDEPTELADRGRELGRTKQVGENSNPIPIITVASPPATNTTTTAHIDSRGTSSNSTPPDTAARDLGARRSLNGGVPGIYDDAAGTSDEFHALLGFLLSEEGYLGALSKFVRLVLLYSSKMEDGTWAEDVDVDVDVAATVDLDTDEDMDAEGYEDDDDPPRDSIISNPDPDTRPLGSESKSKSNLSKQGDNDNEPSKAPSAASPGLRRSKKLSRACSKMTMYGILLRDAVASSAFRMHLRRMQGVLPRLLYCSPPGRLGVSREDVDFRHQSRSSALGRLDEEEYDDDDEDDAEDFDEDQREEGRSGEEGTRRGDDDEVEEMYANWIKMLVEHLEALFVLQRWLGGVTRDIANGGVRGSRIAVDTIVLLPSALPSDQSPSPSPSSSPPLVVNPKLTTRPNSAYYQKLGKRARSQSPEDPPASIRFKPDHSYLTLAPTESTDSLPAYSSLVPSASESVTCATSRTAGTEPSSARSSPEPTQQANRLKPWRQVIRDIFVPTEFNEDLIVGLLEKMIRKSEWLPEGVHLDWGHGGVWHPEACLASLLCGEAPFQASTAIDREASSDPQIVNSFVVMMMKETHLMGVSRSSCSSCCIALFNALRLHSTSQLSKLGPIVHHEFVTSFTQSLQRPRGGAAAAIAKESIYASAECVLPGWVGDTVVREVVGSLKGRLGGLVVEVLAGLVSDPEYEDDDDEDMGSCEDEDEEDEVEDSGAEDDDMGGSDASSGCGSC